MRDVVTVALILLLALAAPAGGRAADVHVAPAGDDAADGSAGRPVRSLRRGLDLVRAARAAAPARRGPVVVELADGRHELATPLTLDPGDSGTAESPTVVRAAPGTRPVVSGGRVIDGWRVSRQPDGGERWTADIPDATAGGWNFAQLFVNDQRRYRPAVPATGWHEIAGALPPSPESEGKGHDRFAFAGDALRADWANLDAVEIVAVHRWAMSRLPIRSIEPLDGDPAGRVVTLAGHTAADAFWAALPAGSRFRAENVREALGRPGTWYLDRRAGTLDYCPLPGEHPDTTVVVAPVHDRLVEIRGAAEGGRRVEHLRFEGLSFAHGNWTPGPRGHAFPQAEISLGGAIVASGVRHLSFHDCIVRHVGRYAFEFGAGCSACTVERCDMADLGAGGVLVGTAGGPRSWGSTGLIAGPEGEVRDVAIRDCTIAHGGRIHAAGVGVWIGHASHCTVEHCDIHDLFYTGVSVGWSWGYEPSRSHHNRVATNRIHHIGGGVLSDMGGVYTLGVSPGTVVEGNVIHDVVAREYGGWGMYTDEGSTGIVMRNNIVHRTSSGGFHQHYGRDNVVENNIFASGQEWQLQRTRVEDHTSFRFERNVVWWDSDAPCMRGDWTTQVVTRNNCYWNAAGPVTFPDGGDLAARQRAGADEGSIVADPLFVDPAAGDFTLAADSPVPGLGFRPIDASRAGRRTPSRVRLTGPVPSPWPEPRPAADPPP